MRTWTLVIHDDAHVSKETVEFFGKEESVKVVELEPMLDLLEESLDADEGL
jgi:hypothetical protein